MDKKTVCMPFKQHMIPLHCKQWTGNGPASAFLDPYYEMSRTFCLLIFCNFVARWKINPVKAHTHIANVAASDIPVDIIIHPQVFRQQEHTLFTKACLISTDPNKTTLTIFSFPVFIMPDLRKNTR